MFRRLRPTIVHTHNPKPGLYGRVAARIARVPVVVNTVHGLYAQPQDPFVRRAGVYSIERVAELFSQANLVQNPEDIETLAGLGIPRRRLTLLGNGIDLTRFDRSTVTDADALAARKELGGCAPGDVVVGMVGRLVREKGYVEVFEAASELRERFPQLRFAVVGDDEHEKGDALTAGDRALAAAAGVRFLGGRMDMARLYAGMDMVVLASHREGFPRSPMEAGRHGTARDRHEHPRVPAGGRRRNHRPAGTGTRCPRPRRRDRRARGRSGTPTPLGGRRPREGVARLRRPAVHRDHARDLPAIARAAGGFGPRGKRGVT